MEAVLTERLVGVLTLPGAVGRRRKVSCFSFRCSCEQWRPPLLTNSTDDRGRTEDTAAGPLRRVDNGLPAARPDYDRGRIIVPGAVE